MKEKKKGKRLEKLEEPSPLPSKRKGNWEQGVSAAKFLNL